MLREDSFLLLFVQAADHKGAISRHQISFRFRAQSYRRISAQQTEVPKEGKREDEIEKSLNGVKLPARKSVILPSRQENRGGRTGACYFGAAAEWRSVLGYHRTSRVGMSHSKRPHVSYSQSVLEGTKARPTCPRGLLPCFAQRVIHHLYPTSIYAPKLGVYQLSIHVQGKQIEIVPAEVVLATTYLLRTATCTNASIRPHRQPHLSTRTRICTRTRTRTRTRAHLKPLEGDDHVELGVVLAAQA